MSRLRFYMVRFGLVCALVAFVCAPSFSHAQNLDALQRQDAEAEPLNDDETDEAAEQPSVPKAGSSALAQLDRDLKILDELKSIRLLTDTGDKGDAEAEAAARALIAEHINPALKPYIGQPLTVGALQDIKSTAQRLFDEHAPAIVRVVMPEQEISSGELFLAAITARVGEVKSATQRAADQSHFHAGSVLDRQTLVDELDWYNRPSRKSVAAVLGSGQKPGDVDIEYLISNPDNPWTAFASWDNHGVDLLGTNRWTFGVGHSDLLERDIELQYHYLADESFDRLNAHIANLRIPIASLRHELRWLGYYADSEVDLGANFGGMMLDGTSWQSSLEYRVPLARAFDRRWRHELVFGYDAKGSDSSLEFGQLSALSTNTEVHQLHFGYEAWWDDKWGRMALDIDLVTSPGNLNPQNTDSSFQSARAGAQSSYTYLKLGVDRTIDLPNQFQFAWDIDAQIASANLLPSEQLTLSGPWAVRGFAPSQIRSDRGLVSRAELRSPATTLLKKADAWQGFGFIDGGWGSAIDPLPGEEAPAIGAAGFGLRTQIGQHFSGDLSYGWQMVEDNVADDGDVGRFQARLMLKW